MFRVCHRGFQFTFTNGLTVSVMWGFGNYCENRYKPDHECKSEAETIGLESKNAEVLIWDETEDITEAIGWLSPEEVGAILHICSVPNVNYTLLNKYLLVKDHILESYQATA